MPKICIKPSDIFSARIVMPPGERLIWMYTADFLGLNRSGCLLFLKRDKEKEIGTWTLSVTLEVLVTKCFKVHIEGDVLAVAL